MAKVVFKFLEDVCGANDFYELDQVELLQGEAATLYFRLITIRAADSDDNLSNIRYLAQAGSTMNVQFVALDSNASITRPATMAFPNDDRSIWQVSILATDKISFGGMKLSLTEGANTRTILPGPAVKLTSISADGSGKYFC
jgi:hypothetical protein